MEGISDVSDSPRSLLDGSSKLQFLTRKIPSHAFTYDAMGNRTDHSASIAAGNLLTLFDGITISYDDDGNVISKVGSNYWQYSWDAENRLDSTVVNNWGMVRFDYNALGKPMRKVTRTASSGWVVDSYYIWDGDQLLAELDASGHRKRDYIYFPGADAPFAVTLGDTTVTSVKYVQQDGLGNVIGTTNSGSVSQKVSYDAWGTPTITGNTDSRLLWKGLLWEGDDVSLYYMRNRWYDPELGRFMSEDPIGHEGGENLYAFSGDDPVNGSDPAGLDCPPHHVCIGLVYGNSQKGNGQGASGSPEGVDPRGASCDPGYEDNFATCTWQRWAGPTRATDQPVPDDASDKAVRACRNAILIATGTAVLDLSGLRELQLLGKQVRLARNTLSVSQYFRSTIPASYIRGNAANYNRSIQTFSAAYAKGVAASAGFNLTAESLGGFGHQLLSYIPIPGSASGFSIVNAIDKCF